MYKPQSSPCSVFASLVNWWVCARGTQEQVKGKGWRKYFRFIYSASGFRPLAWRQIQKTILKYFILPLPKMSHEVHLALCGLNTLKWLFNTKYTKYLFLVLIPATSFIDISKSLWNLVISWVWQNNVRITQLVIVYHAVPYVWPWTSRAWLFSECCHEIKT